MDIFALEERIDSGNAAEFDEELKAFLEENKPDELILDARELKYISSAGLRAILRAIKAVKKLKMINVSTEVYEILDVTGFSEILEVERAIRSISVEGLSEIGRGAHGIVYRIAPDTIVKVYNEGTKTEDILRERELARWAFVRGIPTAIPYDIVRVGKQYGTVFELLDARSPVDYINESDEKLQEFIASSVELMKHIHSVEVKKGELPDMKEKTLQWAQKLEKSLPEKSMKSLMDMINEIPESHTLIHADFHLKNIMLCEGELMLIDMDTLSMGDPIFELATICNSYHEFPSIDPAAASFLGISVETAESIWEGTLRLYRSDAGEDELKETAKKARILGCVRIIDFLKRHKNGAESADYIIKRCLEDIERLLG